MANLMNNHGRVSVFEKYGGCVGSLQQQSRMDALLDVICSLVDAENPHQRLEEIMAVIKRLFTLARLGQAY